MFTSTECFPNGGLIMDAQGSLHGTCQEGGDHVAGHDLEIHSVNPPASLGNFWVEHAFQAPTHPLSAWL